MELSNFGLAPIKAEGQPMGYGDDPATIETTYVERRVPVDLEGEAHELIDNWLISKGYNPEAI